MRIISIFEKVIGDTLEGLFDLKKGFEPFELDRMVKRAMERNRKRLLKEVFVPNIIEIALSDKDYTENEPLLDQIKSQVEKSAMNFIEMRTYKIVGEIKISIGRQSALKMGEVGIVCRFEKAKEEKAESLVKGALALEKEGRFADALIAMDEALKKGKGDERIEKKRSRLFNLLKESEIRRKTKIRHQKMEKVTLSARLLVEESGEDIHLLFGNKFLVGREQHCDLILSDETISRKHAIIILGKNTARIIDLDSANGTFKNEVEFHDEIILSEGDEIRLGESQPYKVRLMKKEGHISSVSLLQGSKIYIFSAGGLILGSDSRECDIIIKDRSLTPRHLKIERVFESVILCDMGGTSGIKINGETIKEKELREGDVIHVGNTRFTFFRGQ